MDDLWMRFTENLSVRVSGLMHLRFILQPIMATFLAIRSGLKDAKSRQAALFLVPHFPPVRSLSPPRVDQGRLAKHREIILCSACS